MSTNSYGNVTEPRTFTLLNFYEVVRLMIREHEIKTLLCISDGSVVSFQKTAVAVLASVEVFLKTAVAVLMRLY